MEQEEKTGSEPVIDSESSPETPEANQTEVIPANSSEKSLLFFSDYSRQVIFIVTLFITVLIFLKWNYGGVICFALWICMLVIWAIVKIPEKQIKHLDLLDSGKKLTEFEKQRDIIKIEDDLRKTLAQIAGGLFFVFGLVVTLYTYLGNIEKNFYERYSADVVLLKETRLSARMAGLYDLENIAVNSKDLEPAVIKVLISFVKERSEEITDYETCKIRLKSTETPQNTAVASYPDGISQKNSDILLAVKIIVERDQMYDAMDFEIDLTGAMLNDGNFKDKNFNKFSSLRNTCLINTDFSNATLSKIDFDYAKLTGAKLNGATLDMSDFSNVPTLTAQQLMSVKHIDNYTTVCRDDNPGACKSGLADAKNKLLIVIANTTPTPVFKRGF